MNLLKEVQGGLRTTYEATQENNTFEAPLLLLVKEVVLDILGCNKGDKNISQLSKKAQKIISSTDINEILLALETPSQKQRFMDAFDANPESRFLNITGQVNHGNIGYDVEFYKQSLTSDERKGLTANWRASYNLGEKYTQGKNYSVAITHLENAIISKKISKDFLGVTYANLGICYQEIGEYEKALDSYFKSLSYIEPENIAEIWFKIGLVYHDQENDSQALDAYLKSQELSTKNDISHIKINLGKIYYNKKDFQHAIEYFLQGLEYELDKDVRIETLCSIGDSYYLSGKLEESLQYYFQCFQYPIDSQLSGKLCVFIGDILLGMGKDEEAIKYFKQGLKEDFIDTEKWKTLANIGVCYGNIGNYEASKEYLVKAYTNPDTPKDRMLEILENLKRNEKANN